MDLDLQRPLGDDFLDQLIEQNINSVEGKDRAKSSKTGKDLAFFEPIQKLTPKHHNVARLVAEGLKDTQIAAITGYHAVRIYQLKHDPLVKELIEFYCAEMGAKFNDLIEKRKRVGHLALDRLEEKLLDDETGPSIPAKTLTEIAQFALDTPQSQNANVNGAGQVNVNITFGKSEDQINSPSRTIELEANK